MALVHLGVGSNRQKAKHIRAGLRTLRENFDPQGISFRHSRVFQSAAVGFAGQDFFNLVVSFQTNLTVFDVNQRCKEIEQQFGHSADAPKFSPRTLDVDLLLYDQRVLDSELQLPRAEILYNAFVLWPLAELSPTLRHPTVGKTYAQLWYEYELEQSLTPINFAF